MGPHGRMSDRTTVLTDPKCRVPLVRVLVQRRQAFEEKLQWVKAALASGKLGAKHEESLRMFAIHFNMFIERAKFIQQKEEWREARARAQLCRRS